MTNLTPIECEARLVGLSKQRRKDGDWIEIKFHIHPDDHPAALFILPLGTDCNLSIKGVEEKPTVNTEAPTVDSSPEPERSKGGERARRAGIFCNNKDFQEFMKVIGPPEKCFPPEPPSRPMSKEAANARDLLLKNCFAGSLRHLDKSMSAAYAFDQIERSWRAATEGRTEADMLRQMENGR